MKKPLDWSKIQNGFSGFEDLAVDFVKDTFKNNKWIPTQKTRDGNRDAYTIVFGCDLKETTNKYWWMEAKYSDKNKHLTRYRLDSTIVSALLERNVARIIFVTNIEVKPKVILDIQNALHNSMNCEGVYFYTKNNLELWLKHNPDIFQHYFPKCNINSLSLSSLVITEQLEIYPQNNNQMIFIEPVRILQKEEIYYGYFSIFSEHTCCVELIPAKKITLISKKKISLQQGENPIRIVFYLKNDFDNNVQFLVNNQTVLPNYAISISNSLKALLNIKSQNQIMEKIDTDIEDFELSEKIKIHAINGLSGSGKSYIINKIIRQNQLAEKDLFYTEFAISSTDNMMQLINLVLFILFPYLPPEDITFTYFKSFNRHCYLSDFVLKLIFNKNNFEALCNIVREINEEDTIFPCNIIINKRFIILDDVHNLDVLCLDFLMKLIINLVHKNVAVFIIIGGQPLLFENVAYIKLKERCAIEHHYCQILPDDLYVFLKNKENFNVSISCQTCENLFPSIIEFVLFIQYMTDKKANISNIDELILECKLFHRSGLLEQYVLNEFSQFFVYNNQLRSLCDHIYWSLNGYYLQNETSQNINGFSNLLSANLVKFNSRGMLIPYHDIYKSYYRSHFKKPFYFKAKKDLQSNLDYIHETLLSINYRQELKEIIRQFEEMEQQRHFYSIMYVLQDIYENEDHQMLKNRLGNKLYLKLFYYYAIASLHISIDQSDLEIFKCLQNETQNSYDSDIIQIYDSATWELINLHYAWLDFENAKKNILLLYKIMEKEQELNIIDKDNQNCLRFHDIKVMETLLASDENNPQAQDFYEQNSKEMLNSNFENRNNSFTVRYAITLVCRNYDYSIFLLKESKNNIMKSKNTKDRYYLWTQFYLNYFQMIYYSDISFLNDALEFCNCLKKNHFMDYRKMILGIAAFFFSRSEIEEGNKYLLSDIYVKREYRLRQKAFYLETVALSEALNGRFEKAILYLQESKKMFNQLSSFIYIIEHNLIILEKRKFNITNIKYCFSNILENNVYYIDPRCAT